MSLMSVIKRSLFPERCFFCQKICEFGKNVCGNCTDDEELLDNPVFDGRINGEMCYSCDVIIALWRYHSEIKKAIWRFKFKGDLRGADIFGEALVLKIEELFSPADIDLITFVPMHPEKERVRGYNQAKLLAMYISKRMGVPLLEDVLVKTSSDDIHALSANQRKSASAGSLKIGVGKDLSGLKILLVDDVITTGSTMKSCASLLRKLGASVIIGASIAK